MIDNDFNYFLIFKWNRHDITEKQIKRCIQKYETHTFHLHDKECFPKAARSEMEQEFWQIKSDFGDR